MKYKRKPIEVEAIQWTGDNFHEFYNIMTSDVIHMKEERYLVIPGTWFVSVKSWVIFEEGQEYKVRTDEEFQRLYEQVSPFNTADL